MRQVRTAVAGGAQLLALDSAAGLAFRSADLDCTFYDDWLDAAARRDISRIRQLCSGGWFAGQRDAFTSAGVCWPEIDQVMMSGFWEEHALQLALADVFVGAGVARLSFFRGSGNRPSLHRSPADTFGRTWEQVLSDRLVVDVLPGPTGESMPMAIADRVGRRLRRVGAAVRAGAVRLPRRQQLRGRVVVAVGEDEAARFESHVMELADAFDGHVVAVVLEPDTATALVRGARWRLPVLPGPPPRPEVDTGDFAAALARSRAASAGTPWESALAGAPFQFEHFAHVRWPRQVSVLRGWMQLWDDLAPSAVVVSSLDDARSQLPAVAAKRAGIPSVAMPHAAFYAKTRAEVESDWLLYGSSLQRRAFTAAGAPGGQLLPYVPPGAAGRPLPSGATAAAAAAEPRALTVLALTNPVNEDHPGRVINDCSLGHRDQLTALSILFDAPSDLAALGLHVRLKTHPLYPDLPLLLAAGPAVAAAALPSSARLDEELAAADVVVGVNYVGSAIAGVAAARKPLVHLWTSPLLGDEQLNPYSAGIAEQGAVTRTKDDFWAAVRAAVRPDNPSRPVPAASAFSHDPADAERARSLPEIVRGLTSQGARAQSGSR